MKKRGVSPIIATILLIVLVVIIGAIVFTWFKSMTQEAITKFDGTNIKLVCEDVQFKASYSSSTKYLTISNLGNVPIYNFDIKIEEPGSYTTDNLIDMDVGWSENGLNQGGIFSKNIGNHIGSANQITLIPILMGLNKEGIKKTQACDERHGKVIPF